MVNSYCCLYPTAMSTWLLLIVLATGESHGGLPSPPRVVMPAAAAHNDLSLLLLRPCPPGAPCNSYGGWPSDRCLPLTKVSIPQQSLGMFCAWRLPHFDVGHSCGPQQSVTAGLLYDIRVRLLQQLLLLPPPTPPPPPPREPQQP